WAAREQNPATGPRIEPKACPSSRRRRTILECVGFGQQSSPSLLSRSPATPSSGSATSSAWGTSIPPRPRTVEGRPKAASRFPVPSAGPRAPPTHPPPHPQLALGSDPPAVTSRNAVETTDRLEAFFIRRAAPGDPWQLRHLRRAAPDAKWEPAVTLDLYPTP